MATKRQKLEKAAKQYKIEFDLNVTDEDLAEAIALAEAGESLAEPEQSPGLKEDLAAIPDNDDIPEEADITEMRDNLDGIGLDDPEDEVRSPKQKEAHAEAAMLAGMSITERLSYKLKKAAGLISGEPAKKRKSQYTDKQNAEFAVVRLDRLLGALSVQRRRNPGNKSVTPGIALEIEAIKNGTWIKEDEGAFKTPKRANQYKDHEIRAMILPR